MTAGAEAAKTAPLGDLAHEIHSSSPPGGANRSTNSRLGADRIQNLTVRWGRPKGSEVGEKGLTMF